MSQLSHYTSGLGLMGILDSQSIWATNIHQLNDAKEFRHAVGMAQEALRAEGKNGTPRTMEVVRELCGLLERSQALSVHVVSFSEDGDALSQWRGYCPDGFGYCIEFDRNMLAEVAEGAGFSLRRCVYDQAAQRAWLSRWAERCLKIALKHTEPVDAETSLAEKCAPHITQLLLEAPFFKHHTFAEEREWRMARVVYSDDPKLRLRAGKSMLIRYLPIALDFSATSKTIYRIRVGPTPHPQLALEGLMYYFQRVHIVNGVCNSEVPYRAW